MKKSSSTTPNARDQFLFKLDDRGVFISALNDRADISGHSEDDFMGKSLKIFIHKDDQNIFLQFLENARKEAVLLNLSLRIITSKGNVMYARIYGRYDTSEGVYYCSLKDRSPEKDKELETFITSHSTQQLEEALKHAERTLRTTQSEKEALMMELELLENDFRHSEEEKKRIQANITSTIKALSHTMRTYLNGIAGMSSLLEKALLSQKHKSYLEVIHDDCDKLLRLANDLFCFSAAESGELQAEGLAFSIENAITSVMHSFSTPYLQEKPIEISHRFEQGVPEYIIADPKILHKVLSKLLDNAIKHTPRGSVSLIISLQERGKKYSKLAFIVEDTGLGMPPELAADVFDPFSYLSRAKAMSGKGTGMSLAVCKKLVQYMGGDINLKSAPGQGTTVTFSLKTPAYLPECTIGNHAFELLKRPLDGQTLKILLVDDDPINGMISQSILDNLGLKVELVSSGEEAIERYQKEHYDIILMDIVMPEMDGLESTKRIRALAQDITTPYIIAMTANAYESDYKRAMAAGLNDYICKPLTAKMVFYALKGYIRNREETGSSDNQPHREKATHPGSIEYPND
ncbi:MAG: hypothetical protein COZ46_07110 [Verrucomicrobia bacterium CG_4_10_14_3_um_filter_43_23]|nr:MAG: hypothetical protein AUJ82_02395 [Verrucomicrobia bacterium CG1_02_43_26]PIP58867.1 MAG: hypothetical protein COX01_06770 [Verrucomicrobia bacterium CG22_combo_CG10-13_8_21_14_all_43_17]PIX57812.1 MAG: hypothetical protein COZ46_07110 [Verrucomicrobia bacterium CG_4_10_14_3_um_filter_43_23]PIY62073.1 MAG: hypothetical protein COY94_03010 [Verrucomicrobia bacterium CG_4_10_14_0_8_um_filter_43_34]PJA44920.1 MAG: hypothetical protein CO175_00420 [Verrucomicrobia bacterium CG_4_9_14_3_um_fi